VGLTLDAFELAHPPPTQAALATYLREQTGSDYDRAAALRRAAVEVVGLRRSDAIPLLSNTAAGAGRRRPLPLSRECGFRSADPAIRSRGQHETAGFSREFRWPTSCKVEAHTTPRNQLGDSP
jgi:hypothetical protein